MIKIEAIIRTSTMHEVQNALAEIGIPTFSVYQVQISGIHKEHKGWRNKTSALIPKSKIELLCGDEDENKVTSVIQQAAQTGEKGDGIVFSYTVQNLIKIKDNQTGADAL